MEFLIFLGLLIYNLNNNPPDRGQKMVKRKPNSPKMKYPPVLANEE